MPLLSGVVPAVTINDQDRDALVASGQLKAGDSDELPNEPAVTQRAAACGNSALRSMRGSNRLEPPLTANSRAKPYEDIGFTSIDIKDPTAIKWACVREGVVSMKNAKTGFLSFEGTDLKSFLGLSSEKDVGSPIVPRDCLALSVKNKKTTIARPEN